MIYKRKDLPSCTGANNNTDILYFLSTSALHPHIDRICFSCSCRSDINKPEQTLFSILKDNNYVCVSNSWIKQDKYKRITMYQPNLTNINVSILYDRKKQYRFYPCMRIIIYKPDIDTIDWFDAICNSIGFTTTLSHAELAIDISPYNFEIYEFLMRHLSLRYHRDTSCTVEGERGSFYIGNKSKNSKSAILYQKPINDVNVLRLEFRLNRNFLKRYELELDCFDKINNIDLSTLISFRQLNREKLLKHLIWKHKSRLSEFDEDDKDLVIGQLQHFPSVYGGVVDEISYMKKVPYINNCHRFFEDIPDVNKVFFERLKGVNFI